MIQRIRTKPTIRDRIERSTAACLVLIFAALFGLLAIAELLCALLGVPFDPRIG